MPIVEIDIQFKDKEFHRDQYLFLIMVKGQPQNSLNEIPISFQYIHRTFNSKIYRQNSFCLIQ